MPRHVGARYEIVKRLRQLGVFVPGWQQLEVSHLRDILAKYEEQAANPKPARQFSVMPKEQIAGALKDFRDFTQARREGRRRIY
jgi:hypothetical protein